MASSSERRSKASKAPVAVPTETTEGTTITFEWPLTNLKQHFESSKDNAKSKVVRSEPFGGGKWNILFYAQSGDGNQCCSLYLNAEPLASERLAPFVIDRNDNNKKESSSGRDKSSKDSHLFAKSNVDRWYRRGQYGFTFKIQTLNRATILGSKDAHDHAFCYKTSNWGWASFAKRDTVYYQNQEAHKDDALLITVTIVSSPHKPRSEKPQGIAVPRPLISAFAGLLDDPDHSDVVFHIRPPQARPRGRPAPPVRRIYAIKKILAARSEYFRDMFEGGFIEGELSDSEESGDDGSATSEDLRPSGDHSPARSARAAQAAAPQPSGRTSIYSDHEHDEALDHEPLFDDSDAEVDLSPDLIRPLRRKTGRISLDDEPKSVDDASSGHQASDNVVTGPRHSSHSNTSTRGPAAEDEHSIERLTTRPAVASLAKDRTGASSPEGAEALAQGDHRRSVSGSSQSAASRPSSLHQPTPARAKRGRTSTGDLSKPGRVRRRHNDRKRRKVVVSDSWYVTFKALLYYLYTDSIEFAPLTSLFLERDAGLDGTNRDNASVTAHNGTSTVGMTDIVEEYLEAHRRRQEAIDAHRRRNPDGPEPCSAKAMYRLADKLQIPDLKQRARDHIVHSLTESNVVWETCSSFTSQFPEVREMEVDFLHKHWSEVKKTNAMKMLFARGHAHPGLPEVWPYILQRLEYRQPSEDEETSRSDPASVPIEL